MALSSGELEDVYYTAVELDALTWTLFTQPLRENEKVLSKEFVRVEGTQWGHPMIVLLVGEDILNEGCWPDGDDGSS